MELTDNDKQRIEQEAKRPFYSYEDRHMFLEGAEYATRYEREQQAKEIERLRETLSEIRHALYARDTDDAILDCIAKHLDEAGFLYESED